MTAVADNEARRRPRLVDPIRSTERWGTFEVAECLGVEVGNIQHIRDLPKPVQPGPGGKKIKASTLWLADDIREFAKVYNARRDRRRKRAEAA